jgi:hypothetical protein
VRGMQVKNQAKGRSSAVSSWCNLLVFLDAFKAGAGARKRSLIDGSLRFRLRMPTTSRAFASR